jgi:hypothetical protein
LEIFSRWAIMSTFQKAQARTCAGATVFPWHHPAARLLACNRLPFVRHSTISALFRVPAFRA